MGHTRSHWFARKSTGAIGVALLTAYWLSGLWLPQYFRSLSRWGRRRGDGLLAIAGSVYHSPHIAAFHFAATAHEELAVNPLAGPGVMYATVIGCMVLSLGLWLAVWEVARRRSLRRGQTPPREIGRGWQRLWFGVCAAALAWGVYRAATGEQRIVERMRMLQRSADANARAAAISDGGWLDAACDSDVEKALRGDPSPKVRRYAAYALMDCPGDGVTSVLLDALKDPSEAVREEIPGIVSRRQSVAIVPTLVDALRDPSAMVRFRTAVSLGQIGDRRAVIALIGAMRDPDPDVRRYVVEALGRIGDVRSVAPLKAGLKDSDEYVRRAARDALERKDWK